ncbi:UDP-N-acetylglucosamine 2-epimerase (non-hydrolyzing) [Porticoccaceae bacterium]|nr:UDP-N-acetylglucosamine 2-epimerase (non-hydrolyzing) [Porticoccaceae bacterium]
MTKVMTIVGTRPEIIRLSRVIPKLDKYFDHVLVHTGQNYDFELNDIFFKELEIRDPDVYLACASVTAAATIASVIEKVDVILEQHKPDAVLILGDTNSAMAAIPAKRRKIPIFHMEAGNRCFDLRVPEEINRKIVDHIADVNLPYSTIARDYLLREGISPEFVVKTGSPMGEILEFYKNKVNDSSVIAQRFLEKEGYFLVSIHREENVDSDSHIKSFVEVLDRIASVYNKPIIVSTHPRTRKRIDDLQLIFHPLVQLCKPIGFPDYISLQANSFMVLSDSGTITEESSILNFPAINIREAQERPEGFEEGAVMFTGMSVSRIMEAISVLVDQKRGSIRQIEIVKDYSVSNVSDKVVRVIISYIDLINKKIWRK